MNLDGELDRQEFRRFIHQLTKDTFIIVSQGLIITMAVAPTVALLTKKSTEGVPGVGKVVQKVPGAVYASLVTLAIVLFQNAIEKKQIYNTHTRIYIYYVNNMVLGCLLAITTSETSELARK